MSKKSVGNQIGVLAVSACFAALSIVLGKFLAVPVGDTIRLSFENLPILLAGFFFGPLTGAAVGIVADLVGCVLRGYAVNPIITLGAALIGVCAGVFSALPVKSRLLRVLCTVIPAHLLGSVLVKTIGLVVFYSSPFLPTLGWRAVTYTMISAAEVALLYLLTGNRAVIRQMSALTGGKAGTP